MKKTTLALIAGLLWCSAALAQLPEWDALEQNETTTLHLPWEGLNGLFQVGGTFGGATVTLEWKLDGIEVWTAVDDLSADRGASACALATDGAHCWFRAPPRSRLRPVVTGGDGTTDIKARVSGGDHASVGGGAGLSGISEFSTVVGDGSGSVVGSIIPVEDDGTRLAIGLTAAEAAAVSSLEDIFLRDSGTGVTMAFQHGTSTTVRIGQIVDGIFIIDNIVNTSHTQFLGSGGIILRMDVAGRQLEIRGVEAELLWTSGSEKFTMGQMDVAGEFSLRDAGTTRWYVDSAGNMAFGGSANPARPVHVFGGFRNEPQASPPTSPSSGDSYTDSTGSEADCVYLDGGWVVRAGAGTCA